jgi:hypothetical protein
LIRLDKQQRKIRNPGGAARTYWEEWFFDVTDAGLERVEREHRSASESDREAHEGASGSYDWETEVLPVLQAVYTARGSADADLGVSETTINEVLDRQSDDSRTERVLTMLIRGDYLETTIQTMGSRYCQITEKGLQITAAGRLEHPTPLTRVCSH